MPQGRLAALEARELRLAEALRDGLLSPEIFRLAIDELRRDRGGIEAKAPIRLASEPADIRKGKTILGEHEMLPPRDQRLLAECVFVELHIREVGIEHYMLHSDTDSRTLVA